MKGTIHKILIVMSLAFLLSGCAALSAMKALGGGSSNDSGIHTNANLNVGGEQNGFKRTTDTQFQTAQHVNIQTGVDPLYIIIGMGGTIVLLIFLLGLGMEKPGTKRRLRKLEKDIRA